MLTHAATTEAGSDMPFQDFGRLQRRKGRASGSVCFERTGVMVECVAGRFVGGESIEELAKDYALPVATIEAGLRLILAVKGVSLASKRAEAKIAEHIPLLEY